MQPVSVQYRDEFPSVPSLIIDGFDMTEKVAAGGLTIQHRPSEPALVTIQLGRPALSFDGLVEVEFDEATQNLLRTAGWVKAEEVSR